MDDNVVKDPPSPERLAQLVVWLAQVYPDTHQCVVVHSGAHLLERSTLSEVALGDLCKIESAGVLRLADRPTLYVPAI